MESNTTVQADVRESTPDTEKKPSQEEIAKELEAKLKDFQERNQAANEAMKAGKGRLALEAPIQSGDETITELAYDFTELTGIEYADAMDTDPNAQQAYRITYRQGLALFARAAAKQTERLDMQDIIERIGATDAVEGVQLATLFFNASTRAGRLRISKK
ncbi:MAG: hypothetical protein IJ649_01120 [Oscillospiraceae bacterium]|nr:hypothetical protein [Oscillospiraceae bacterium]